MSVFNQAFDLDYLDEEELSQVSYTSGEREATNTLSLLSYNIQAGIATEKYRHYLTRSWKHVLPAAERSNNLDRISELINGYDIVALQEVDAGSIRSNFINQTRYLAENAGFPYWYDLTNRNLGLIAQQSIGILSRLACNRITEHRLPGFIPGRGALVVYIGDRRNPLVLVTLHLSLSRRARKRQLEYIVDLVRHHEHVIIMGDMNCSADSMEMEFLCKKSGLHEPLRDLYTFPSWNPFRNIDHILVTPTINIHDVRVLNYPLSDHLPIAMDVELPEHILQ